MPAQMNNAGTNMLPVPRMMLAKPFISQSKTLPAKTTLE